MAKWSIGALRGTKKDGYTTVMNNETGEIRELRNPSQKGALYASELKADQSLITGKKLTKGQKLFRRAYLTARRDNADAYNANKAKTDPVFASEWARMKEARKIDRQNRKVNRENMKKAKKAGREVYVDDYGDRYM
jgi:hypothetical protein